MPVTAAQIEGRSVTPPKPLEPNVTVRVTRRGHGKIATGIHDVTYGDELYADGETFSVAGDIARELEDRGFVVLVEPAVEVPTTLVTETPEEVPSKVKKQTSVNE